MDVRGEEDFWEFFEEGLHLFLGSSRIFECIGETISTSVVVVWLLFVLCRQCGNVVVVWLLFVLCRQCGFVENF